MRLTIHGRTGAEVDYYRSVIGTPRVDLVEDPAGSGSRLRIMRVEGLREILTCRECWDVPAAQGALRRAWLTGELASEP